MTAKVTLTAVDKSHGMSLVELRQNIDRAIEMGCTQIGRTRIGWKGQIQSIEVLEPKEFGVQNVELKLGDDEVHI